jgi:hypothetical protein
MSARTFGSNYTFMGVHRAGVQAAFDDLRRHGFLAKRNATDEEAENMGNELDRRNNLPRRPYLTGAVYTMKFSENNLWPKDGESDHIRRILMNRPAFNGGLRIHCVGINGVTSGPSSQLGVAKRVQQVLAQHGLHPRIEKQSPQFVPVTELNGETEAVVICPALSRLPGSQFDRNRAATVRQLVISNRQRQEAHEQTRLEAEMQVAEDRIQRFIERYAQALCDQGIIRSNQSTNIHEAMRQRNETLSQFYNELSSERTRYNRITDADEQRVLCEGAKMAKERLAAMLLNVQTLLRDIRFASMPNAS